MSDKSPDAFRTISEVADWLGVQPHVLRFWESKFSQVRPVKRAGGRRYYRPNDMLLLGGIRKLLHEDGLTIKGAQKVLREEGMSHVAAMSQPLDAESAALSALEATSGSEPSAVQESSATVAERDHGPVGTRKTPPVDRPESPTPAVAAAGDPTGPSQSKPALEPAPVRQVDPAPAVPRKQEPPGMPAARDDASDEDVPKKEPLPSFMRDPSFRTPAATKSQDAQGKPTSSDRLPSFLQPPRPAPPSQSREADTAPAKEIEAELPLDHPTQGRRPTDPVATPKPRIVDAPDPDETMIDVAPGALSAAFSTASVSPARRADILPIVARLAALRDRMAAERGR